jgi:hypothetical protein
MANLHIPFCYDKFTTNFFLPDGSFGTIVGGSYTSPSGDVANLVSGEYTLVDGQKGNIYSDNASARPDTATLPIPTQFTASGVGTAIPASALGGQVTLTYTTTLPGSTIPPFTIPPVTIYKSTTIPGTTIPGSTGESIITTVTTTEARSTLNAISSAGASAEAKKNGAVGRRKALPIHVCMVVMLLILVPY